MFPSHVAVPDNWATEEGVKAREQIESTADLLRTSDELLEYSITLSPDQIKEIREYNKTHGGYANEKIYSCDPTDETATYRNCTSEFLDILRGKSAQYGDSTEFGTFNQPYTTGVSNYNSRK